MRGFWNDRDGVSERDYLLLTATTVFFLFIVIGLVMVLLGEQIDQQYIALLGMVAPVLMTVAGGLFGVRIAREIRRPRDDTDPPMIYEGRNLDDDEGEDVAVDYDARV